MVDITQFMTTGGRAVEVTEYSVFSEKVRHWVSQVQILPCSHHVIAAINKYTKYAVILTLCVLATVWEGGIVW